MIFPMSVNLAALRIATVVRIPVSGNRKNPRFLRFLGQVEIRLKGTCHTQLDKSMQKVAFVISSLDITQLPLQQSYEVFAFNFMADSAFWVIL